MKNIIAVIITFFLASCVSKDLTKLQQLSIHEANLKSRGSYEAYLALEYLAMSRNLFASKDLKSSEYFANKGLDVTQGVIVVPENPLNWMADPNQMEEMIMMQKRLEIALNYSNIKFHLPIQTAHLTYLYDCWISRESKAIFRADELAQCRTRYSKLLDEIEHYIDELKKGNQRVVKIEEPKFKKFEILFDLNSSKFNNRANKVMVELLDFIKTLNGNYRVLVVGNADRTGSLIYNQNLAFRRAKLAQKYLIKNGVAKDLIKVQSLGESFPDIITKDNVQQQRNRSVAIYILDGFGSFESMPLPLIENNAYREEIKKARKKRGLSN